MELIEPTLNIKCPINKITLNEIVKKNNLYLDPRG